MWAMLGLYGANFWALFLRAKNYVIFSTKKLGLERPMSGCTEVETT